MGLAAEVQPQQQHQQTSSAPPPPSAAANQSNYGNSNFVNVYNVELGGGVSSSSSSNKTATAMRMRSPVLIQRLIIFHDGLMPSPPSPSSSSSSSDRGQDDSSNLSQRHDDEDDDDAKNNGSSETKNNTGHSTKSNNNISNNNKHEKKSKKSSTSKRRNPQAQLSEDASLEEHGEFILYYYDHSLHSHRQEQFHGNNQRLHHDNNGDHDHDHSNKQQRRKSTSSTHSRESLGEQSTGMSSPWEEEQLPSSWVKQQRRASTGSTGMMGMSNSSLHGDDNGGDAAAALLSLSDHASEEAVKFAGICRALRSFPLAFRSRSLGHHSRSGEGNDKNNGNRGEGGEEEEKEGLEETEVVHLTDSTLIFIPLELNGDIVAVAQVPRASNSSRVHHSSSHGDGNVNTQATAASTSSTTTQSNSISFHNGNNNPKPSSRMGYGADPIALRKAIRQIHEMFSLICGGGIHRRLLRTRHLEHSEDWVWEAEQNVVDCSTNSETGAEGNKSDFSDGNTAKSPKSTLMKLSQSSSVFGGDAKNDIYANEDDHLHPSYGDNRVVNPESNGREYDYCYGGMKELFQLRREHRKLTNERQQNTHESKTNGGRVHRWDSSASADDLFNDIVNDIGNDDYTRRIDKLLQVLPITKLREDLMTFYDEWLGRWQHICEVMEGGVGRCIVEMIPTPIWRGVGNNHSRLGGGGFMPARGQYPPLAPDAFVCLAASEFMTSLLEDEVPRVMEGKDREVTETTPRLFGISLLFHDRLVLSKALPIEGDETSFPPEISRMIVEYFRSPEKSHCLERSNTNYRATMSQFSQEVVPQDVNATPTPTVHHAFDRFMSNLSIGAKTNADSPKSTQPPAPRGNSMDHISFSEEFKASTGYIEPPPSSFIDLEKPPDFLFVPNLDHQVWLPQIHLPHNESSTLIDHDSELETHVAMFERGDFTFLLFFDLPVFEGCEVRGVLGQMEEELQPNATHLEGDDASFEEESTGISDETVAFTETLCFLKDQLTEFCNAYSCHDPNEGSHLIAPVKEINSDGLFLGEPGMDIVYIDREQDKFVLLSQHDLTSRKIRRVASNGDSSGAGNGSSLSNSGRQKKGLFGLGSKIKESCELETKTPVVYQASPYTNIMDCRHKLAAYLPLDVMLAFDDMFNEIGRRTWKGTNNPNEMDEMTLSDILGVEHKPMELCTFLPQTWVYGRADGCQELYVLLDTRKFVTISDVQKAVSRVREKLFNNKLL